MLPLSVNRTLIGIQRDKLLLMQVNRLSKRVLITSQVVLPPADKGLQSEMLLPKLEALLASVGKQTIKSVSIVIASDFVRYLTLPAVDNVMRATDRAAFAKATFYEIYGAAVEEWLIQCDDAAPGHPTLCAAIDLSLFSTLTAFCRDKGIRLISVQPYLMSAFNCVKSQLSQAPLYFSIVESGRLLITRLNQGKWQHVRNLPLEDDWVAQLNKQLERERMFDTTKERPNILVYVLHDKTTSLHRLEGWHARRVGVGNKYTLGLPYVMFEVAI